MIFLCDCLSLNKSKYCKYLVWNEQHNNNSMCARVLWMFVIVKLACMILFPIIWVLLAMIPRLHSDVEQLFYALPATPQQRVFTNKIEFNNSGGHLQGVQPYFYKGQEYTYFSGSSSTYAYLAVADANEVKKLHKLMFKP